MNTMEMLMELYKYPHKRFETKYSEYQDFGPTEEGLDYISCEVVGGSIELSSDHLDLNLEWIEVYGPILFEDILHEYYGGYIFGRRFRFECEDFHYLGLFSNIIQYLTENKNSQEFIDVLAEGRWYEYAPTRLKYESEVK